MKPPPSLLAVAIERNHWEAVALCLLLGVSRAARSVPPETLEEMIEALASETPIPQHKGRRRGHS